MELFVENYKGFTKALIPIVDISFFVGDNSTGKSSILKLLNLVTSRNFWFNPQFNSSELEFGYFSDMVNKYSKNQSEFSIGLQLDGHNPLAEFVPNLSRIIYTFGKDGVNPIIKSFQYLCNNRTIRGVFSELGFYYQSRIETKPNSFEEWFMNNQFSEPNYLSVRFNPHWPVGLYINFIEDNFSPNRDKQSQATTKSEDVIKLTAIDPIRAKAQRTYESYKMAYSAEGAHTPALLNTVLSNNTEETKRFRDALIQFGHASKLFDTIKVVSQSNDKEAPFSIMVGYSDIDMNIINVGYGVSQILPIITQILNSTETVFAIQQPEVHLHPKAQAAFGDLMFQSAINDKNQFCIETHSNYTIDRFRYTMHSSKGKKPKAQVVFFTRDNTGNHISILPIDKAGHLPENTPAEYDSFFIDEDLKMLDF